MEQEILWLWLAAGLGSGMNWMPLWERYHSIDAIWQDRTVLADRGLLTHRQAERLLAVSVEALYRRQALQREKETRILTWDSPDYPDQLRTVASPPIVLYAKGDVRLLQNQLLIGVVGTRHPSNYGVEVTRAICDELAKAGAVLVSGLAEGLDSEAHKAALRHDRPTVAVLGTDLERCFPARNRQLQELIPHNGVLLSEYACDEENINHKVSFVQRNRIIAGLCLGLCVAEARLHSGTMSTVRYALESDRDVFAVPGSIFSPLSEGTNQLLKQGAHPVTNAADILHLYGVSPEKPQTVLREAAALPDLTGDLLTVYSALPPAGKDIDMAALCTAAGLSAGKVMAAVTRLEMRGLVRQKPGRRFEKAV